jgi:hypothetical protein
MRVHSSEESPSYSKPRRAKRGTLKEEVEADRDWACRLDGEGRQ